MLFSFNDVPPVTFPMGHSVVLPPKRGCGMLVCHQEKRRPNFIPGEGERRSLLDRQNARLADLKQSVRQLATRAARLTMRNSISCILP